MNCDRLWVVGATYRWGDEGSATCDVGGHRCPLFVAVSRVGCRGVGSLQGLSYEKVTIIKNPCCALQKHKVFETEDKNSTGHKPKIRDGP